VKLLRLATALIALAVLSSASGAIELDSALPAYKPVSGLYGNIKSVGSDTLGVLMRKWADGFKALYPNVKIDIESKGSATAPPAKDGQAETNKAGVYPLVSPTRMAGLKHVGVATEAK
jgi:ABC-type phosphate transport system substrate-binding protein